MNECCHKPTARGGGVRLGPRLRAMYRQSARALAAAVEAKDPTTRRHALTVSRYAVKLGRRLGLPQGRLGRLQIAALLHDIGKIAVPDAILQKPGRLTSAEFALIARHPQAATRILRHARIFEDELPIILFHHERFDGSGYPAGLAGEEIPFEARILTVADSLEAMLSPRSYKAPYSVARARGELLACSGRQFDPRVIMAAISWLGSPSFAKLVPRK